VKLIAGTPPGGGQDRAARALAAALEGVLDVPMVVANTSGLGGANAWAELAGQPGDGHILSISSPTLITNRLTGVATVGPSAVTQVALLCTEYIVFGVPAASPVSTADDLIDLLGTPGRLSVSLATARGNVNHIAVAYLCRHTGTEPGNVDVRVFESARHAITDVLDRGSGVVAVSAASVVPEVTAGELRVLAVSAPERLEGLLAAVPTWGELGIDCTIGTWRGVIGPPQLPEYAVAFWDEAMSAAVREAGWEGALARYMWSDTYLTTAATVEFITREECLMRAALSELGLLDG
jgi:putative tricarboxylic transport membrane protein